MTILLPPVIKINDDNELLPPIIKINDKVYKVNS